MTEVHATADLHRKQQHDETLQEYIQNFTDLTEKVMGADPVNIMNRVIIFLFINNLYNCDINKCIAGAKTINTLADACKLYQSLLKLKHMKVYCTMRNMKCLKYNGKLTCTDTSNNSRNKFANRNTLNKTNKTYTYLGTCWKCNEFGPCS